MTAKSHKIAEQHLKLRANFWPQCDEKLLWKRLEKKGFITIPRCMPLIMKTLDDLSSGQPISDTYLDLWCRSNDACFADITNQAEVAFSSGFDGQRGILTWKKRVLVLQKLGFIELATGPSGPVSYALIFNPYKIIKKHAEKKGSLIQKDNYNALIARMSKIGADDLEETV